MPTKLDIPEIDDLNLLNDIINERQNGRNATFFSDYEQLWRDRYLEYINNNGDPTSIPRSLIAENDKDKFINLYKTKPGIIKTEIDDPLRSRKLNFCPFCGESGTPNTLDHFLPKDVYPEFSVLSKNLIPACDICQDANHKGTKVLNNNNERYFVHPYFDDIEGLIILKLNIFPPFDNADFELVVNEDIDDNLFEICQRHINELKIDTRYRTYFKSAFIRLKKLVRQMIYVKGVNPENIENRIEMFFDNAGLISINFWDTVFYRSVLNNVELINYLKVLPDIDIPEE